MNLPFDVIRISGAEALNEIESIRSNGKVYPVLLGNADEVDDLVGSYDLQAESTDELVSAAMKIDVASWLSKRAEADPEYYEGDRGNWPEDAQPNNSILGHIDLLTGQPHREVAIALIPTSDSWQVPCYLQFGGWNSCPYPTEHSAVLRRWQEKYGAEVVTITRDTLETRVKHPPKTRDEALALAHEHFIYCTDIVRQSTLTIDALAATLLNASTWYFWWD